MKVMRMNESLICLFSGEKPIVSNELLGNTVRMTRMRRESSIDSSANATKTIVTVECKGNGNVKRDNDRKML